MDRFDVMRSFRRVVERGNFGKAAEDLGLSPAGLSKQIRFLEERLGVLLLQRTTRTMSLTAAGQAYFNECCRILDEVDELEESISDESAAPTGRLRVNAPSSFGLTVMSPLLPKFLAAFPKLKVDLTLNDQLIDMVGAGFDVSIRIRAELADSSLVVRRLGDVAQIICAAPSYLAAHGTPTVLADFQHHVCFSYSLAEYPGHWHLTGPDGPISVPIPVRFSANSSLMLRDLLLAGQGIGALPSFLARSSIASGDLVEVLPEYAFAKRHAYVVYPTGRYLQRKVRVFSDFLAEELQDLL